MIIDKFHCYLLVISVAFQIACNSSNQSSSNIASKVSTDKVTAPISRSLSEQDPLENNYLDHAVLMVHSEPLKVGKADILRYLSEHPMKIRDQWIQDYRSTSIQTVDHLEYQNRKQEKRT